MELAKGVMAYGKIKMAGGKTAVKRKSKTNAKRKTKSWSEQELNKGIYQYFGFE